MAVSQASSTARRLPMAIELRAASCELRTRPTPTTLDADGASPPMANAVKPVSHLPPAHAASTSSSLSAFFQIARAATLWSRPCRDRILPPSTSTTLIYTTAS
ncbi:hypothetical protein GGP41_002086 [Bipolaris sorokiniana]|uniref:Uncharacterized protein n=1 Tax=Cochliobolus sativus TaxID=45130 RepID=A0A8H5ZNJ4_COCSA|nr:hypothetical protein GGP41_002086 [Bipolaris sorokiniana]